jgi:NAD(P)-dependent dehydrogenase (short-subunit alcohol dehydrogenase family)
MVKIWYNTEDDQGHYAAISTNVEHPMKVARIAIRCLLSKIKKSVVLYMSSLSGLGSKYRRVLYCAIKHAIVGLVKGIDLADELEVVKVVTICPGCVYRCELRVLLANEAS